MLAGALTDYERYPCCDTCCRGAGSSACRKQSHESPRHSPLHRERLWCEQTGNASNHDIKVWQIAYRIMYRGKLNSAPIGRPGLMPEKKRTIRRSFRTPGELCTTMLSLGAPIHVASDWGALQEHRAYSPGDNIRRIDHMASAKTGRTLVKKLMEEEQTSVTMLIDQET